MSKWFLLCLGLAACAQPEASDKTTSPDEPFNDGPVFGTWIPDGYQPVSPQRLIVFGDSVSVGEGSTRDTLSYANLLQVNDDGTWPDSGEEDLESLYGPIDEVHNVAVGGAMTQSVLAWQLPDLDQRLPDVVEGETIVVATIGGNDMVLAVFGAQIADDPEATAQVEVDEMVANLHEIAAFFADPVRFPDPVYLYITNVYEPTDTVGQAEVCFNNVDVRIGIGAIDMANLAMLEVAQDNGYAYVDMRSHFLGHGHNATDPANDWHQASDATTWFQDDCIHPTDRGHHEIRRLFWAAIAGAPLPPPD